ncbi:MAG: DUF1028 domain-containing protein [Conexivisphaerales archaeon]
MIRTGTYSIVAIDKTKEQIGVGVQSHWFSVGSIVTWAKPSAGAVATQAFADPRYGYLGIELMSEGISAKKVLKMLLSTDEKADSRQVAMVDFKGEVASHTGKNCLPEAGHVAGEGYSAQGNIMKNRQVWIQMADAFERSEGELADRILASLYAGQKAGGDIRGMQSAAILVVKLKRSSEPWLDKIVDLRVEDSSKPLEELTRILTVHKAYVHADKGDAFLSEGKLEEAMKEYKRAFEFAPANEELRYWYAIGLLNSGKINEGLRELKAVYDTNPEMKRITPKLPNYGMLKVDEKLLKEIT